MATIPSADETARLILKAMVFRLKFRAGQSAGIGPLNQAAQQEGVESRDVEAGLEHAIKEG